MKRTLLRVIFLGFLFSGPLPLLAYEIETHADMSREAAKASVLRDNSPNGVLRALGLQFPIEEAIKQVFPNSKNDKKSIIELFRDGSRFEDNFLLGTILRVRHHFYDPLYDQPLTVAGVAIGEKSPDWALEDISVIGSQDYSWRNARQYLYDALTLPMKTERDENFGKTFQTLGHVIHHLQDMAQPQHVRNDIHPSIGSHKSLYEDYTDQVRGGLLYTGYPSATFPTPRHFWTDNGQGIADFTNANFVSAGTNFDKPNYYTYPRLADAVPKDEDANVLLQSVGLTPPPECLPPNDSCVMTFFGTAVNDAYRSGASGVNERTSTQSIFDQDLKVAGQDPAFSLNRFNFDSAHPFLIPRAVGYSAGLIDYFPVSKTRGLS